MYARCSKQNTNVRERAWTSVQMMEIFSDAIASGELRGCEIADFYWIREGQPLLATIRNTRTGKIGLYEINFVTGRPQVVQNCRAH